MLIIKKYYAVLILLCAFQLNAMEGEGTEYLSLKKKNARVHEEMFYVDLSSCAPDLKEKIEKMYYFKEYKGTLYYNKQCTFRVDEVDPLAIKKFGALSYFFTSALRTRKDIPKSGRAVQIPPEVERVVAVRGKLHDGNRNRIYLYLGLLTQPSDTAGYQQCKDIYCATILAAQVEHDIEWESSYYGNAKELPSSSIYDEVKKYLPNINDGESQDRIWESAIFQKKLNELLLQDTHYPSHSVSLYRNGRFLQNKERYWINGENRLKNNSNNKK